MSFSSDTKNELARLTPDKKCCILAEIAAFIRFCGKLRLAGGGKFTIVLTTEIPAVARRFNTLIKNYFNVETILEVGRGNTLKKRRYYSITIGPGELSQQILRETGILMIREGVNYLTDGIYDGLIKTKCCRKSYLRGAFLAAGTMTNPEKAYQFEIVCATETLAADMRRLINTFVDLHAKKVLRKSDYVVYVKESGQILDLLAIMGAHSQYFAFEDVRFKKELRNEANRQSNCDQANIDKALSAAGRQIENIEKVGIGNLPAKLQEIALLRLENPYISLTELGEMLTPPLKKSGVSHRMKRIEELAKKG
ncbi:MAG: DNA-binding protein WhiA [Anaerovoracaceae bacterium]|jgi:DNA-binding protein WhiA